MLADLNPTSLDYLLARICRQADDVRLGDRPFGAVNGFHVNSQGLLHLACESNPIGPIRGVDTDTLDVADAAKSHDLCPCLPTRTDKTNISGIKARQVIRRQGIQSPDANTLEVAVRHPTQQFSGRGRKNEQHAHPSATDRGEMFGPAY